MILTNLQNTERIESLHPLFKKLFDYVKTHNLAEEPTGRIDLDGDNLFINNSNPTLIPAEKQVLEMHRKYIDVQILLEGEETVGWKALEDLQHTCKEYDEEGDYALSDEKPTTYFNVKAGQIYILYPEDLHAPIIGEGTVRKAIGKVLINI